MSVSTYILPAYIFEDIEGGIHEIRISEEKQKEYHRELVHENFIKLCYKHQCTWALDTFCQYDPSLFPPGFLEELKSTKTRDKIYATAIRELTLLYSKISDDTALNDNGLSRRKFRCLKSIEWRIKEDIRRIETRIVHSSHLPFKEVKRSPAETLRECE